MVQQRAEREGGVTPRDGKALTGPLRGGPDPASACQDGFAKAECRPRVLLLWWGRAIFHSENSAFHVAFRAVGILALWGRQVFCGARRRGCGCVLALVLFATNPRAPRCARPRSRFKSRPLFLVFPTCKEVCAPVCSTGCARHSQASLPAGRSLITYWAASTLGTSRALKPTFCGFRTLSPRPASCRSCGYVSASVSASLPRTCLSTGVCLACTRRAC